ncbi:MAG: hypothetical protein HFH14_05015 [Lachnospiraceae bacterium]|nr:hypothetical protein [Lachnospiraceae bacterium]
MSKWKKLFGIFMVGAVLVTGGTLPQNNMVTAAAGKDYGIRNPRVENGVVTWDKIKFGSYYQDAKFEPEPIKWRVLSVDGDNAFLFADKNLDVKPYNEEEEDVTWETCTLRKWLNEHFYDEAFDEEEKEAVIETTVINENNSSYNTKSGNNTIDKVYLLSRAEACDVAYGFDAQLYGAFVGSGHFQTRESKNTDYAKVNNVMMLTDLYKDGLWYWWLRSSDTDGNRAPCVSMQGEGSSSVVSESDMAVRPVLNVNLSSSKVKDAGEVDSDGNITSETDGIHAPRIKDGVTTWDCVYFGSYRQSCTFEKNALEWRVLSVTGDDAFLLADKNIDCKLYNEEKDDVTWEICTLRKWLNENFYNEAFDAEEKKAVKETTVVNDDNPVYDTEGGNDTNDKVYLLSVAEARNAVYGFGTDKACESKNTDYAKVNNVWSSTGSDTVGNGIWWLRSPGTDSDFAAYVYDHGGSTPYGQHVDFSYTAVRPALHINLASALWSKTGEVRSDGQETDNSTLSPSHTPTPNITSDVTEKPMVKSIPSPSKAPVLKKLKVSDIKCAKNAKKITGKVSVSKASVRIKVGKKAYKKASVKGKKFTLKLNYRLKKKTKVTVKAEKKGYKKLIKVYTVK